MKSRIWVLSLILLGFLCSPQVTDGGETHLNQIKSNPKLFLKALVNEKDYKILEKVIQCESSWKTNAYNSKTGDVSLLQINLASHLKKSSELGYNVHNWQDNLEYGVELYNKQGLKPWSASKKCWNKSV